MKNFAYLILFIFLFFSCEENGGTVGPCVHEYMDPVVSIEKITDAATQREIQEFVIKDARIDSFQLPHFAIINEVSYNIVSYDSVLYCNTPCGFGHDVGTYFLTISAVGYQDTTISFYAEYAHNEGGCPSYSSGSTLVEFAMQRKK